MSLISGFGVQPTALLKQPDVPADGISGKPGPSVGAGAIRSDGKSVTTETAQPGSKTVSGFASTASTESQVRQGAGSGGTPGLSADTQRLVDMAIAANIDGPAAKFLATVMIKQLGEQHSQALQDMMAARLSAVSLLMSGADQLEKAGKELAKAAVVGLVLNIVSAVFSFTARSDATGGMAMGMSKGFGAGGAFAGEKGQANAKLAEAEQKRDDAMAEQANAIGDRKKAMAEAIQDLMKQLISFVHDYQQTIMSTLVCW